MGAMQNNGDVNKRGRQSRGSVRNGDRLAAFSKGKASGKATWGNCHAESILQVIELLTNAGGAVIFSLARDKGAHSITLMLDESREVLWFNGDADLTDEMGAVAEKLKNL